MKQINEYLTTKLVGKTASLEDYVRYICPIIFGLNPSQTEKIISELDSIDAFKRDFDEMRVMFYNESFEEDYEKEIRESEKAFVNVHYSEISKMDIIDLVYDMNEDYTKVTQLDFEDVYFDVSTYGGQYNSIDEFEKANDKNAPYCIKIYSDEIDTHLIIECCIGNPHPKLETYNHKYEPYLQLSERRIMYEIDKISDLDDDKTELFYQSCSRIVEERLDDFNKTFDLDVKMLGNNGKHLCVKPSFKVIHYYDKLMEEVEKRQNWLIQDLNDEADYFLNDFDE